MATHTSTNEDGTDESAALDSIGHPSAVVGKRVQWLLIGGFGVMAGLGVYVSLVQPSMLQTLSLMLIFGLFAIGFDFAFGFSGMHSFGHAAMFGGGGYVTAYVLKEITTIAPVVLLMATVTGVVLALLLGFLGSQTEGIYFAMVTLASAQVIYVLVLQDALAPILGRDSITGGDNGIFGIPQMTIPGLDLGESMLQFYLFTLVLAAAGALLLFRIANSRFGSVLRAIQQNEERVTHLGYDVRKYKLIGFAISGGISGLAGGLLVSLQGIAHPGSLLNWVVSGDVIFMTLLGGMGTLWGPMLGAGLYVYIRESLHWFPQWRLLLAGIFLVVIIFFPAGLAGVLRSADSLYAWLKNKLFDRE
jgi:branched-chain amino acid transport system permease protein